MKKLMLVGVFLLACSVSAEAAITILFVEDLGLGENTPLPAWPNATAAEANFLSMLTAAGTETFEGMTPGLPPTNLSFPLPGGTITATFSGSMTVEQVTPGTTNGRGRYAIDGSNYLEGDTGSFVITFSEPVSAVGFYGIDIGDFGGQATLTTQDGTTSVYNIPHTIDGPGGSVLFFGLIDTTNTYSSIEINNDSGGADGFGFDRMTVGIPVPIPAPGAMVLGALGTGLVGWLRRRRAF